ncbi:uncharacterized protein AB675_5004 [Cyphellophora attinorum]|uniref:CENP-V/GFA domain-containing protein n=1 Tax=Cyphellophora attinorum TaxID=1664694 RepID=A0A0N1P067_9EURO|nr:uncharacterized protein AB675_5004 [Phialophora attinorum]KPI39494.1 hypothetical protein AB675_5004 [Phialophora attinorum]
MSVPVTATCLCGRINETVHLEGPLPQHKRICHCDTCRYTTGVLYLSAPTLASKPDFVDRLTRYESSNNLSRYFCASCGSHMFIHVYQGDKWDVCSGVVDQIQDGSTSPEVYTSHEFVDDTIDGGLAICMLRNGEGQNLELYAEADNEDCVPASRYTSTGKRSVVEDALLSSDNHKTRLRASCHCGGVEYYITRPTSASKTFNSPWPDLIVASQAAHSDNPDNIKWWIREDNKYLAGTCTCRSCRLASGVPVQTWAFVPQANIEMKDGKPWQPDFGTLGHYNSSKDVTRDFCKTCGATVFWRSEARPELIDVSIGLLRAAEGARAESWLHWWTERISFCEEALDWEVVRTLAPGLKTIRKE